MSLSPTLRGWKDKTCFPPGPLTTNRPQKSRRWFAYQPDLYGRWTGVALLLFFLIACSSPPVSRTVTPLQPVAADELQIVTGQTLYVPAYAELFYGETERTTALAVTLAIHNTDLDTPIIIQSVRYHDTNGQLVRDYINEPVQIAPLATTGFLVEAGDQRGGWGANFIVIWGAEEPVYEPIVEAIMVSTSSGLGMAMISSGRVISQTLPIPTPATAATPAR